MKQITLRQARQKRGLTQEQLEALSGVSQRTISGIEIGATKNPGASTVMQLAAALDMDPRAFKFGISEVTA